VRIAAAVAFLVAVAAPAAASPEDAVVLAKLENGASIGFALVRTGVSGAAGAIGEASLPRSNSVNRVLWDRESGAYFGYRVDVERHTGERPFRVSFKPLDRAAVEQALRQRECPGCPPPAPLGAGPQFPPPQQIGEGEALTLELLANAETGERILDVVMLSAKEIGAGEMRAVAGSALEGQLALRRAAALVARGQFSTAAEEYRKALKVQPNDATVHNTLGICYQRLNNDAMARREYDRALELRPGYAAVWNNIGTLEQSRKRFKPAVRAYKKAIELKPALATAWKNLGNAYLALGQVQETFEAYQEAFRLDPTILEAQDASSVPAAGVDLATHNFVIAKLLAQGGHKDAALDFLRRAREAGFRDFARLQSDEAFRSLWQDSRFRDLVAGR